MSKTRKQIAEKTMKNFEKYVDGFPAYCKTKFFLAFIILADFMDITALYTLFSVVITSDPLIAKISTAAVVCVLDVYSLWLMPMFFDTVPIKKQYKYLGISLATVIITVSLVSVIFRISTGDISTSTTAVELTNSQQFLFNSLMGIIPIASTVAISAISVQKQYWDHKNIIFKKKQKIQILKSMAFELEKSMGETIDLQELDEKELDSTKKIVESTGKELKARVVYQIMNALGDETSVKEAAAIQKKVS